MKIYSNVIAAVTLITDPVNLPTEGCQQYDGRASVTNEGHRAYACHARNTGLSQLWVAVLKHPEHRCTCSL